MFIFSRVVAYIVLVISAFTLLFLYLCFAIDDDKNIRKIRLITSYLVKIQFTLGFLSAGLLVIVVTLTNLGILSHP